MNIIKETIARKEKIENTEAGREAFRCRMRSAHSGGHATSELVITQSDLEALRNGYCLAIDDGEYSTFITIGK